MVNYVYGYARVSTETQNLDRQLDALNKYGVDHIYNEKMTGTKRDRPKLSRLLDTITEGDTIVIESLSRLGRSTKDLIELTELFHSKGVHLVSLKESIDTNTSTGKLLFTLMSAIAQFERDTIADRTLEGLKSARARGRTGGRPKANADNVKKAVMLYNTKQYTIREIEEMTGLRNLRYTEVWPPNDNKKFYMLTYEQERTVIHYAKFSKNDTIRKRCDENRYHSHWNDRNRHRSVPCEKLGH